LNLYVQVVFRTGVQIYNPYFKSACDAYIKFEEPTTLPKPTMRWESVHQPQNTTRVRRVF